MKKKMLLTSLMSIAMLTSITVGATYALFTAESNVNIAVTSGKVSVVASIDQNSVKTKQLYDTDYTEGLNYTYEGVITFNEEGLSLEKFVPGDGVKFNIVVKNESNVTAKYRTIINCTNDDGLFDGLKVSINDGGLYDGQEVTSEWTTLSVGSENQIVPIEIELPEGAGNEYQGKTCTISYKVEAIQGNVYTGPYAIIERYTENELPTRNPITGSLGGITFPDAPDEVTVEAAWTFAATDTEVTVQESIYKDWVCDFIIECDGDVALGELGLWGAYGGMDFAFANPIALPQGQSLFMMTSVGMPITYEYICTDVKEFECGVFRGLVNPQMQGKKITVSLALINPDYATDLINEVSNEFPEKTQEEIMLEVMKKSRWESAIGTNVLIANKTVYSFE